jgi:hypothetical protein
MIRLDTTFCFQVTGLLLCFDSLLIILMWLVDRFACNEPCFAGHFCYNWQFKSSIPSQVIVYCLFLTFDLGMTLWSLVITY